MTEKILLVDDEEEFLETLAERMRNRDMEVSTTTSPSEALERITKESFDAIVLDFQMPEMDGLAMLKIAREKCPELQVILLTGHATVDKGIEAMKLGAMDFLEKPADIENLVKKIKKAQAKKLILVEKKTEEKIEKIIRDKGW